ncbi:MAG: tetratricopeptide repeat protein [Candidatus Tectomicrobia bacterium]|nr:tetratricopeptide repeat protein [Candidatus Tectomicrobia bacterium]
MRERAEDLSSSLALKQCHINVLFKNERCERPRVSLVLLDWSCRESFHLLHYLGQQTIPRDQYEIIWIEYYQRVSPEITEGLQGSEDQPPIVDQWVVLGMPETAYYHKHLMYNVGLVLSRGEIVIFCDSDAMVKPTFVETIIRTFEQDPDIVLHLDEVRNNDRRFHPFNYPSFEEVVGSRAINWTGSTTTGLVDRIDPLHSRNYGACMGAQREDLIEIGGADEQIDYLGHICGPYEMTFRLVNAQKREVWHPTEFLYHVWHPGQAGDKNYLGPHDGRHMSTTALAARWSGRVLPLVENRAVQMMRLSRLYRLEDHSLLSQVIDHEALKRWNIEEMQLELQLVSSGRSAYEKGLYSEAIESLDKASKYRPDDSLLFSTLGWAYYFYGNDGKALAAFHEALRLDPGCVEAIRGRGWVHHRKGRYDEAIDDFCQTLKQVNPQEGNVWQETLRGRGWAYFHKGDLEAAIRDFEAAMAHIRPDDRAVMQDLYRGLGWASYRKEKLDLAIRYFGKALENIDSQDSDVKQDAIRGLSNAWGKLGWISYYKRRQDNAIECFTQIINLDPQNLPVLRARGWAYLLTRKFSQAIVDFTETLEQTEASDRNGLQEALRGRGWAYYQTGKFIDAIQDFNRALEKTDPDDEEVLRHLFRGRAWASYCLGNIDTAVQDWARSRGLQSRAGKTARILLALQVLASSIRHRFGL